MNQIECLKSKVEGLFYYKKAHPPHKQRVSSRGVIHDAFFQKPGSAIAWKSQHAAGNAVHNPKQRPAVPPKFSPTNGQRTRKITSKTPGSNLSMTLSFR